MGFIIWTLSGKKPQIEEQISPLFIISTIGFILEVIILMAVYTIKIEGKYRKK